MYCCYKCNRNFGKGAIHFAYDRTFCSELCRESYLLDDRFDKKHISWKKIPNKIESSGIVYPYPNIKSTKSILKGLDNIDISSLQSKSEDYNYEYKSFTIYDREDETNQDNYYFTVNRFMLSCFIRKMQSIV